MAAADWESHQPRLIAPSEGVVWPLKGRLLGPSLSLHGDCLILDTGAVRSLNEPSLNKCGDSDPGSLELGWIVVFLLWS